MTKETPIVRTYPGGAVASGEAYSVKRHSDDVELASGTLDGNGQFTYAPNLSPGPHYWTVTDATPDPDAVRVGSSKATGSGGAYSLAELPLTALRVFGNGVIDGYLNELAVTYDAAGLDLDVATGAAVARGIPAVVNTGFEHAVATARDVTNPKQCYLLLEFTGVGEANEGKVEIKDSCGAAAASPSLPSLTQTEATYQLPLATFRLPNTGSTTLTQVTDVRTFVGVRNPVVSSAVRRTDPTSEATTTSTTGADVTSLTTTPTLLNGVAYDITARAFLIAKISSAAQTVQIAPYIDGSSNIATYVGSNSTEFAGMANVHTREGVVGAGATISCGLRIKVSGGTATYQCGYLLIVATPRT